MIADILPRYQVTSDGSTVAYTVPFELINNAFVNIYVASEKQTSGYTVNVSAKTITFDNAPDEGKLITIIRAIPINWEVSNFGSLNEESLDRALTLLTAKMQTFEEELSRTPKTKPYDKETGSDLSELFFTEMRDALDSLEQAKVIYAQIQASGTQALADITTEKNSAISDIDDNSSDRIGEFNLNATNKTTAFNTNANTVTDTFNQNATDKTNAFNTNAAQKQAAVDASATAAATSATNAATSASNAATSETNAAATEARINETLSTYVTYVGDPAGEVTLKNKDDQTLIPHTELATANKAGRVKPDGTTTSVDSNGTMSVVGKQDTLVSGTNIKTVNGNSLLGSGDVAIGAQVSWGNVTGTLSDQTDLKDALDAKADDSEVVKLTGNQTIAGEKTFNNRTRFTRQSPTIRNNNDDWSTTPAELIFYQWGCEDKNGIWLGGFEGNHLTDGSYTKGMYVRQQNGSGYASIIVGIRPDGSVWTSAPTPATSDNSTKIATTAFVKNQGYLTSHQSLSNYVTLNSAQTITGNKTVQNTSLAVKSTVTDDEASSISGNIEYGMVINDKNGSRIGNFYGGQLSNGKIRTYMCACRPVSGTMKYQYADIQQNVDGTGNFNISCSTATAPTPATADNSTKIATTAFVKNQGYLTSHQSLANYVTLNSNQTIGGTKTFSSSPVLPTPATSDNSTKGATTAYVNNKFQVVTALPASPTAGVFYFVKE